MNFVGLIDLSHINIVRLLKSLLSYYRFHEMIVTVHEQYLIWSGNWPALFSTTSECSHARIFYLVWSHSNLYKRILRHNYYTIEKFIRSDGKQRLTSPRKKKMWIQSTDILVWVSDDDHLKLWSLSMETSASAMGGNQAPWKSTRTVDPIGSNDVIHVEKNKKLTWLLNHSSGFPSVLIALVTTSGQAP